MAKQRSRTLIEHLGFQDPDLTSPVHDEMILWIQEHVREYVEKGHDPWKGIAQQVKWAEEAIQEERERRQREVERIQELTPKKYSYDSDEYFLQRAERWKKELEEARAKLQETERLVGRPILRPEAPPIGVKTEFEKTITTGRDFIVGFVDVVAEVNYPRVYAAHIDWYDDGKRIRGYDRPPELRFNERTKYFYFEAKPKIPSLGELLRQIRTYQEYLTEFADHGRTQRIGHFVIVSPDVRFRTAIESQGIEFWESPHEL